MNDTQTWTLIGGFLAVMVGMSGLLLRVVGSEIRGLRGQVTTGIGGLRCRRRALRTAQRGRSERMTR